MAIRVSGPLPAGPVIIAIWKRLRRIAAHFAVLAAHIRAGTLPAPKLGSPTRRHGPPRTESATAARLAALAAARKAPRLPNRLGWLTRMRPGLHCFGGRLRHLLNDQEFLNLLAASPEIRKLIRSLCRMFGLPLIPLLREPRSNRPPKPRSPSRVRITKPRSLPPVVRALLAPTLPPAKAAQHLLPPLRGAERRSNLYDPLVPVPRRKKPA